MKNLTGRGHSPSGWVAVDMGFRFPGDKFQAVANSVEAR